LKEEILFLGRGRPSYIYSRRPFDGFRMKQGVSHVEDGTRGRMPHDEANTKLEYRNPRQCPIPEAQSRRGV